MRFYNREKEISRLQETEQASHSNAQLTVVTGRRRIGKTQLILKATESEATPALYFFVARKAENYLCQDFQQEITSKLGIPVMGEVSSFGKLFEYLMILSGQRAFTLIIDEFQEFFKVAPSAYSDLSAIARGENTRAKIEAVVKREIGGYLTKLEQGYGLIAKSTPIFAKVETKNVRYVIEDNFLMFWFRFIYKYGYMIEVGNYEGLKTIIDRDYKTFSGKMLEKYFRTKFIQSGNITHIGGYWDRKGENEIDLVVVNEIDRQAQIIEIKRKTENIDLNILRDKGAHFLRATGELKDYQITCCGLSMDEM